MGSATSKQQQQQQQPQTLVAQGSGDVAQCPVQHHQKPPPPPSTKDSSDSSGCPVMHHDDNNNNKKDGSSLPYNVYSQQISPTNQMPLNPNQRPAPFQQTELSTKRVQSSIPKGNTDQETWTYPSPQMFYNALARKGKLSREDDQEQDIETVVAIHNQMNEQTWRHVLEWEQVLGYPAQSTKLLKFCGRPHDLSPKARLKHYLLGHPLPFDRHDWTVQRPDGTQARYVIDYYHNDNDDDNDDNNNNNNGGDSLLSSLLLVDVRPALTVSTVWGRAVQMPRAVYTDRTSFRYLPLWPDAQLRNQVAESQQVWQNMQRKQPKQGGSISKREAQALSASLSKVIQECRSEQEQLKDCNNNVECTQATLNLNMCMAQTWCPVPHQQLMRALKSNEEEEEEEIAKLLETLHQCVQAAQERTQQAKEQHESVFS